MHNKYAIRLQSVSKVYKLHGSQKDQLIDVLGLGRIGLKPKIEPKEFVALDNINLDVPRGHRIGIVGRNGAGKTTLLKLLCGNFSPTQGDVEVNGEVQALMNVGLGFHPEYTGRENVEASLQYNGLAKSEYEEALDGIIEFCELGDFFDQPFKTYSLGMQARLMFASATAIRPDILIVDEVLGAGDAYFIAKSKRRVEQLVAVGCTMLLVSHSMSQILELCSRTIWIHEGRIHMEGDSFDVVKAYEAFLHGTIQKGGLDQKPASILSEKESKAETGNDPKSERAEKIYEDFGKELKTTTEDAGLISVQPRIKGMSRNSGLDRSYKIQEPRFWPGEVEVDWSEISSPLGFNFIARGGLTQWPGTGEIVFSGFTISNSSGATNQLINLQPARFVIEVTANESRAYKLRYAVVITDHLGKIKANLCSEQDTFRLQGGETRTIDVEFLPLQLGENEYIVSLGLYEYEPLELINSAVCHDLLSRCFEFQVLVPESRKTVAAEFSHSAMWNFPGT